MALTWGDMFYIGLYREKHETIFLSETTMPRALIFGMKHHLVDLYEVCANKSLGPKMVLPQGHMFYRGFIWKSMKKNLLV